VAAQGGVSARKNLKTIGIIAPFGQAEISSSLFYYRVLQGIQTETERFGINVALKKVSAPYDAFIQNLGGDTELQGLIVLAMVDQDFLKCLALEKRPLVLLDSAQPGQKLTYDSVSHEAEESSFAAVQSLLHLGHREIGLLNYAPVTPAAAVRQKGYERALAGHGIAVRKELMHFTACRSDAAYAVMRSIMRGPDVPTALFCTSDEMAIGAMMAVKDHGWQVPRDCSIIGFGDLGQFSTPALSTVSMPVELMGASAVRMLQERMSSSAPPAEIKFPTAYVPRASSGFPREKPPPALRD
jgi:LacI family transcriptional regulator